MCGIEISFELRCSWTHMCPIQKARRATVGGGGNRNSRKVQGGAAWGLQGQLQLQRPVQNGMEKQAEGVRKIYESGFGCVVKQSARRVNSVKASLRVSD